MDDTISIGVTHKILINDEDAWIKFEITSKVKIDEDENDAITRVNRLIQQNIIGIIEDSAKTILEYTP